MGRQCSVTQMSFKVMQLFTLLISVIAGYMQIEYICVF